LVVEPKQAFKHDRAFLFALLDHAMSQLKLSFINYERDEINMEKVLEATGLSTDSLNFVELAELVVTNFKQNVNLLAQPGVCENIWMTLQRLYMISKRLHWLSCHMLSCTSTMAEKLVLFKGSLGHARLSQQPRLHSYLAQSSPNECYGLATTTNPLRKHPRSCQNGHAPP
jgi:hypothetical protein